MRFIILVVLSLFISSCGTFTGIPSHGGGKRFAIEQELISASVRAVSRDLNVDPLIGKKVSLYIVVIGDEGGGNLAGGRYSLSTMFRRNYISTPTRTTENTFPVITGTDINKDLNGALTSSTVKENVINSPSKSTEQTSGDRDEYSVGFSGPRNQFLNQQFYNPKDSKFLNAVLQEALFLKGVILVPADEAEISLFVTVDVFGTVRSKRNWIIANQERLLAKTGLEMIAINNLKKGKRVIMEPVTSSFEAEYIEQYYFWTGPFMIRKEVRRSHDLLVDFKDLDSKNKIRYNEKGLDSPVIR
jgi:hypothetical protein